MNVLIDTCVILDELMKRESYVGNTEDIVVMAARGDFSGFVTAKTILDVYYYMHRMLHGDKETREYVDNLGKVLYILDIDGGDCLNAVLSPMSDYEDAVMVESAVRNEMDYIVTRNVKDFKESKVKVIEPEDFLALFRMQ